MAAKHVLSRYKEWQNEDFWVLSVDVKDNSRLKFIIIIITLLTLT
jgi:hypothetical protein